MPELVVKFAVVREVITSQQEQLRAKLLHIEETYQDGEEEDEEEYDEEEQEEEYEEEDLDFDHYSKKAWHVLNTSQYTKLSGSKQYDASWDATAEVEECIAAIDNEVHDDSSFNTKVNALETLRKIGKTILLSNDTLGHEVRKQFQMSQSLPDLMLSIVETMDEEDQIAAGATKDAKGSLADKIDWVRKEADGYGFGDEDGDHQLKTVVSLLRGIPVAAS